MIKKKSSFIFVFILLFISLPVLAAVKEPVTKSFDIQGVYGETLSLEVEPIAAQVSTYIAGMPFNILDLQVSPEQSSGGRQIARWNAASNTPFIISVSAEDMFHVDDSNKQIPLTYILTFKYDVSVSERSYPDQVFEITSGSGMREFTLTDNLSSVGDGYIGILNGGIFFRFTDDGWATANLESTPSGEYKANVTISLKGM